ncbi:MAG: flagellar filament capping protein FliD, partial [Desulfobacteraceae bacterium]
LTNNSYGSDYSFTIEENNELFWNNSSTPIDVDNGKDVAGTINGESATGSGQNLTGDDGEANIDGLVIKYTGTGTGEVGNLKLTLGVAELFDRTLFAITDKYEGYVGFKQESLSDRINQIDEDIERLEARLDQRMEMMINRFVAMELAMSKIQSMSSWLTGQLNAASSGWA